MPKSFLKKQGVDAKRLMIYPLAMILSYLPANVDTSIKMITGNSVYPLLCIHMATAHSIGFIDFLIYGILVRQQRKKRQKTMDESQLNPEDSYIHGSLNESYREFFNEGISRTESLS